MHNTYVRCTVNVITLEVLALVAQSSSAVTASCVCCCVETGATIRRNNVVNCYRIRMKILLAFLIVLRIIWDAAINAAGVELTEILQQKVVFRMSDVSNPTC